MHPEVEAFLQEKCQQWGFSQFGIIKLERPLTMDFYKAWIDENLYGGMDYLKEHQAIKENSELKWPRAKSAFVFSIPYYPHPEQIAPPILKKTRLSLYAQGYDYHHWFKHRMMEVCEELKLKYPEEEFIAFTDSSPILERDLAQRAGLGWVGKNTCLIHPQRGSLFFIGEIYTSLDLASEIKPVHNFCGTCTRCIDICPTQALVSPKKMDAARCISYLTIESKDVASLELREKIGDWFFGCDLCQTVCPWNERVFKSQLSKEPLLTLSAADNLELTQELAEILMSSGKQLSKRFKGTPLSRASAFGLKRNALVVAGNRKIAALTAEIEKLCEDPRLGELAQWALNKINSVPAS